MNLIKSISSIASSSVLSQAIGAFSVWLISHRYGMAEVGHYAMIYSNVLIGAQVCTFASQLLIPRQEEHELGQNVVFCLLESLILALPWAVITGLIFHLNIAFLYLLTFGYALVLIAENLSLRGGNYQFLTFQRIAVSLVVAIALLAMPNTTLFYIAWMAGILLLLSLTVLHETLPVKSAASVTQQQDEAPVLKNRRFMRYCLIQAFMMAGLFSYIGSSSFVIQSEYAMSAMQFSLLFGLNGIGLIIAALIFSRLARRFSAEALLRGGQLLAVTFAAITLLFAWLPLPTLALVGLFFTVSMMSGISTVAGAEAMNAINARQSGTASALMGTLMFVFGGIAAPLAGLGGETMLKMSFAMSLCYLAALLIGLKKPRPTV